VRDISATVAAVVAESPLPESLDDLDAGAIRLLTWHAARAGQDPQQFLTEQVAEQAKALANRALADEVLARVRPRR